MKGHSLLLPSQFQAKVNITGSHRPWYYLAVLRVFKGVLRNISNVIVYIDDLPVHMQTHEDHLKVLEQGLDRLHTNNLKINLDKCFFGNKEVSYLGFMLTPEGIKPGKNNLKAIKDAKPPTDVKMICSFVGLCNFFRTHIKNFPIIAAPLFRLTCKDSGYKGGPLPKEAMDAFCILKNSFYLNQSWPSHGLTANTP
jgi:Reverse transcriptase (RNA-dependent DNA polymerase)